MYSTTPNANTSNANIVAAIGVPNNPANPAAIPVDIIIFFSFAELRSMYFDKYFPNVCENVAPICTATPSRPADPPNR